MATRTRMFVAAISAVPIITAFSCGGDTQTAQPDHIEFAQYSEVKTEESEDFRSTPDAEPQDTASDRTADDSNDINELDKCYNENKLKVVGPCEAVRCLDGYWRVESRLGTPCNDPATACLACDPEDDNAVQCGVCQVIVLPGGEAIEACGPPTEESGLWLEWTWDGTITPDCCQAPTCFHAAATGQNFLCGEPEQLPNFEPCNEGLSCSHSGQCIDGVCDALPVECDDDNACTSDSCSEDGGGCVFKPADPGTELESDDPCVVKFCSDAGSAVVEPVNCDDGNACTIDLAVVKEGECQCTHAPIELECLPLNEVCYSAKLVENAEGNCGCVQTILGGFCSPTAGEEEVCHQVGSLDSTGCQVCGEDEQWGFVESEYPKKCNDGNECTWGDVCLSGFGCLGTPAAKPLLKSCEKLVCDGVSPVAGKSLLDGWCLFQGECVELGHFPIGESCQFCGEVADENGESTYEMAFLSDNAPCDDKSLQTADDKCLKGKCVGDKIVCPQLACAMYFPTGELVAPCDGPYLIDQSYCLVGEGLAAACLSPGDESALLPCKSCQVGDDDEAQMLPVPDGTTTPPVNCCHMVGTCQQGTPIMGSLIDCQGENTCLEAIPCAPALCELGDGCLQVPKQDGTPCTSPCTQSDDANGYCLDNGTCFVVDECEEPDTDFPTSCLEILEKTPGTPDGEYTIDPDGPGPIPSFMVQCDMTTSGGGWTAISSYAAFYHLGGTLVAIEAGTLEGIDALGRPFAQDKIGSHAYYYEFSWPPGYKAFHLMDFTSAAFAEPGYTTDLSDKSLFYQTEWQEPYLAGGTGDVGFGAAEASGPSTTLAFEWSSLKDCDSQCADEGGHVSCTDCIFAWPAGTKVYDLNMISHGFRIGFGETGPQHEGWWPWWSGQVMLR